MSQLLLQLVVDIFFGQTAELGAMPSLYLGRLWAILPVVILKGESVSADI